MDCVDIRVLILKGKGIHWTLYISISCVFSEVNRLYIPSNLSQVFGALNNRSDFDGYSRYDSQRRKSIVSLGKCVRQVQEASRVCCSW